ncbi:hypothetical protein BC628DRAFT_1400176 [Trametes gibbosa]|nr:hypothetical protein BC628DRAFT_1400176 [Trametes gibbosa]
MSLTIPYTILSETPNGDEALQGLSVSISFLGRIPLNLRQRKMPLQVTISVPEPFSIYTFPILSVTSLSSTITDGVENMDNQARDELRHVLLSLPIPFLSIAPPFDWRSQRHWASLSQRIGDWLRSVVSVRDSSAWVWGRDAFWIAFIGAYPAFPAGDWPKWPLEIALEGTFITHWIMRQQHEPSDRSGDSNTVNEHHSSASIPVLRDVHGELWARYRQHISILGSV